MQLCGIDIVQDDLGRKESVDPVPEDWGLASGDEDYEGWRLYVSQLTGAFYSPWTDVLYSVHSQASRLWHHASLERCGTIIVLQVTRRS